MNQYQYPTPVCTKLSGSVRPQMGRPHVVADRLMRRISVALLFLAMITASVRGEAPNLYAVGNNNGLFTVNTSTGKATLIGNDLTGNYSDPGLAFLGTKLYVTNFVQSGSFNFGTLNRQTAAFSFLSNQAGSPNWFGLAANRQSNVMYTVDLNDNNKLKAVSPAGIGSSIGTGTGIQPSGLAYDNTNQILYATTFQGGFYTINTATGVASLVGNTGLSNTFFASMSFDDQHHVLYLDTESSGVSSLYTVNIATGQPTLVGSDSATTIQAIAYLVPEPSTLTLAVCALLAGGCSLWWRFAARWRRPRSDECPDSHVAIVGQSLDGFCNLVGATEPLVNP